MTINELKIGAKVKINQLQGEVDWIGNESFRFKYVDKLSGYWIKDIYQFSDLDKFKKVVNRKKKIND